MINTGYWEELTTKKLIGQVRAVVGFAEEIVWDIDKPVYTPSVPRVEDNPRSYQFFLEVNKA